MQEKLTCLVGPMMVGNRRSAPSPLKYFPDWLLCYRGWFIVVEFKDPDGTTAPKRAAGQADVRAEIVAAGGLAIVAESVEDVQRLISRIDDWDAGVGPDPAFYDERGEL